MLWEEGCENVTEVMLDEAEGIGLVITETDCDFLVIVRAKGTRYAVDLTKTVKALLEDVFEPNTQMLAEVGEEIYWRNSDKLYQRLVSERL
ncbi:MAG: hypothetical protein IJ794_05410 [Lachnospiraceae bacterium]|nr:hypothetical protein [Lachnospiraceae bacterium]